MDLLFSPKVLARAVVPWLALLLAVTGAGSIAYEVIGARPEVRRFASEGRRASGTVLSSPAFVDPGRRDGGPRNRSLVGVNDDELGPQVVSVYGRLDIGATVPVICLTQARRCMAATEVQERVDLWPLTPMMLAGAVQLGLAALLTAATRRFRAGQRRFAGPPPVSA